MNLLSLTTQAERHELLRETAKTFEITARQHDENNTFPHENIRALQKINYPAIMLPISHGGLGINLAELVKMQQIIAEYDGATALSIGWSVGITKDLGESQTWEADLFNEFANDVLQKGALINNAASEPATGSPTRGGKPETTVSRDGDGWIINGRKNFTTLSPVLDYFVVSATIPAEDQVARFLVKKEYRGVQIEETWNSVAMRATGSHDLVLKEVKLPNNAYLFESTPGKKRPQGWLLHIPATYHGISIAAFNYALNFANNYAPNSFSGGTIAQFPMVQHKLGQMRIKVLQNEHFLQSVAKQWDQSNLEEQHQLAPELAAVKVTVVNNAIDIVDLAMRLVGARSLSLDNPLQRYYRNVRAGLHNPPMEDMVTLQLAQSALKALEK